MTLAEIFGHTSFCLVALSYTLQDMLWLRGLAVCGASSMLVFTYFHPHGRVLWLPFRWNVLFVIINSCWIAKLLSDAFLAENLTEEQSAVRDRFTNMSAVDFARLLRISTRRSLSPGEQLLSQGQLNSTVYLVVDGSLDALVDGVRTYTLRPGNFIAEGALHAGALIRCPVRTSASVVASSSSSSPSNANVVLYSFERGDLIDVLEANHAMRNALQASLCWDIVQKLKRQRKEKAGEGADKLAVAAKSNKQTLERYKAVVGAMLGESLVVSKEDRKIIDKYRAIHVIDDSEFETIIVALGWSLKEFNDGSQAAAVESENKTVEDLNARSISA